MSFPTHVRPCAGIVWRDLGEGLIVLNGDSGQYFRLDESAAAIWRLLASQHDVHHIVEMLADGRGSAAAAVAGDIRAFVDGALTNGLLVEGTANGQDAARSDVPTLQITAGGLSVNGSLAGLRDQFATNHFVCLPRLVEENLLKLVLAQVNQGEFIDRSHGRIGTELCLVPGIATGILQLAFNDADLLRTIADIAGCGPVGCFDGRVYRMVPGAGHYDSWHSDVGEDRQVAVSLNLSPVPYQGGLLEIRPTSATVASHTVSNTGLGDAVMFRVAPELRHRVGPVEGVHPRTAYAGWFRTSPSFEDLFTASLSNS